MPEKNVKCCMAMLHGTPVFAIAPGPLESDILRVFGATFDKEQYLWLFPAYYPFVNDVVRDLKIVFGDTLELSTRALAHISDCAETEKSLQALPYAVQFRPGFNFVTTPREHQKEALKFAIKMMRCGILYDMGLGKTKIAIDLIRHEQQKTLVLTPLVGVQMWQKEIKLHAGDELKVLAFTKSTRARAKRIEKIATASAFDVVIVTYGTAKRYADQIMRDFPFTIIIADESHNLRDQSSIQTKAACFLATRASRRVIMSGTPSLGNPLHLYGQLGFLGPYIPATNFWTFKKIYTIASKINKKWIVGYKNLEYLNDKVQRICIRKTKEECLDLPLRTIIDHSFTVENNQLEMYNGLVTSACAELGSGYLYEAPHAAAVLQKLLQVLSGVFIIPPPDICDGCRWVHSCVDEKIKPYTKRCQKITTPPSQKVQQLEQNPKLDLLAELLDEILVEQRNKVIIWACFVAELDTVENFLVGSKIPYVRVDGSNSSHAQEIASQFNESDTLKVYLGQIATGVALTLNSANYMIYYGLSYKLDEYLQSMDRNYRIGQESPVFVYRLLCENSVLEFVARALAQKVDIADTLTDRIDCAFCKHEKELNCLENNFQPFKEGCVYKDRVARVITRPQNL